MPIQKEFKIALVVIISVCVACLSCFIVTAIYTNTPAYKTKKAGEETARKKTEEEKRLREEKAKYKFSKEGTDLRKFEAVLVKDAPGYHNDVRSLALSNEGRLEIQYEQHTGFLDNRKAILLVAMYWFKFVYEKHDFPFVNDVVLLPVASTKDRYGRERESIVARMSLRKEVGRKIVYNNITADEFGKILLLEGEFRPLVKF